MNFTEALDILRKGNRLGATEDEAVEAIKSEIALDHDLPLTLAKLGYELTNSKNPSFSYQILRAIIESGNDKIEEDVVLQGVFIDKTLGSESVQDGVLKCMMALMACTKTVGD